MKKSVVISIALIYALSIFLVTFFGLKHSCFNEIVYVSQIEIIEDKIGYLDDGTKLLILPPSADGVYKYQLKWKVTPDNATNSNVEFIYDKSRSNFSIDENGLITITSQGIVELFSITVRSSDGTKQSDAISLMIPN